MIRWLIRLLEEVGSVADRSGKAAHRNIRNEDNMEIVQQMIHLSQFQPFGHFQIYIA